MHPKLHSLSILFLKYIYYIKWCTALYILRKNYKEMNVIQIKLTNLVHKIILFKCNKPDVSWMWLATTHTGFTWQLTCFLSPEHITDRYYNGLADSVWVAVFHDLLGGGSLQDTSTTTSPHYSLMIIRITIIIKCLKGDFSKSEWSFWFTSALQLHLTWMGLYF